MLCSIQTHAQLRAILAHKTFKNISQCYKLLDLLDLQLNLRYSREFMCEDYFQSFYSGYCGNSQPSLLSLVLQNPGQGSPRPLPLKVALLAFQSTFWHFQPKLGQNGFIFNILI
ncbi:Hypothetical_protein [Hexamita inflata]|uniref:Hypothetical_protein n=1 Tax=Hexamita inflata TaxID=28002 RepID=A0AA86PC42_9EUKA|nr:Hypothetical protein HINF_LOCUS21580 [Hexamita inflata]